MSARRGGLANYLKLTALQETLSLRDFVAPEALRHPCPACGGALQMKTKNQRSSKLGADFLFSFAEREAPRNCPYNPLIVKHLHNFELCSYGLCMAKRVLKMAIRCLPFDRSMSTMQLQSSVCQRIGNTVSFFCQHSMHIFIKKGRSGPYVSKMTTFCLYMAAGSVV